MRTGTGISSHHHHRPITDKQPQPSLHRPHSPQQMSQQSSRAPGLHGGLWTKAKPSMVVPSTPPVIVTHDVSPLPEGTSATCRKRPPPLTPSSLWVAGSLWTETERPTKLTAEEPWWRSGTILQYCMIEGEHRERWDSVSGLIKAGRRAQTARVQELCESRGGRSGLSVLMSLTVSVDVKQH